MECHNSSSEELQTTNDHSIEDRKKKNIASRLTINLERKSTSAVSTDIIVTVIFAKSQLDSSLMKSLSRDEE